MLENKGSSDRRVRKGYQNPPNLYYHYPYVVHASVFDYSLNACSCNVCGRSWRLWDDFLKTFYSLYPQRRQKPVFSNFSKMSIFQLLQTVWKFDRELWCKVWFACKDIWAVPRGYLLNQCWPELKALWCLSRQLLPEHHILPPCITIKSVLLPKDWDGPQHSVTDAFRLVNNCLLGKDWSTIPLIV